MPVTARERVQKLKWAGKTAQEAVAGKPLADLDPVWRKAMLSGDLFVRVVYFAL
jgi:cyclase